MKVRILDGRVTSSGPASPGRILELPTSEAAWFIREGWAEPAHEIPAVVDMANVQAPPPEVDVSASAQAGTAAAAADTRQAGGSRGRHK